MAALFGGTLSLIACLNGALPRSEGMVRHFQWGEWIGFWAAGAILLTGVFWLRLFVSEPRTIVVRRGGLAVGKRRIKFEFLLGFAISAEPQAACSKVTLLLRNGNRAEYGVAHEDEGDLLKTLSECGVCRMPSIADPPFPVDASPVIWRLVVLVAVLLAFLIGAVLAKGSVESIVRSWTEPYASSYSKARSDFDRQMESVGITKKVRRTNWHEFARVLETKPWPALEVAIGAGLFGMMALWHGTAFLAVTWLAKRQEAICAARWKQIYSNAFGLPLPQSPRSVWKLQVFLAAALILLFGGLALCASERNWERGEIARASADLQTMQARFAAENISIPTQQFADLIHSNLQFTVARNFLIGTALVWIAAGVIAAATLAFSHAAKNFEREIESAAEWYYKSRRPD